MLKGVAPVFLVLLLCGAASAQTYFPPELALPSPLCRLEGGGSKGMPIISEFENRWYSKHLGAAREPSLYEASRQPDREAIRFTWLRSFHAPVIVRATLGRRPRLVAKQLSGRGGYDPGTIARSVDRPLSRREAAALRTLIERTHVMDEPQRGCEIGTDGAQWLIESVDRSGYHFVGRWTPRAGPVRAVGEHLLSLTGWQFENIY